MAQNTVSTQGNLHTVLQEKDRKRKAAMLQRLAQEFRITVLDILRERAPAIGAGLRRQPNFWPRSISM